MDHSERARRYISRMEPSISGSGGHNAAYAVAVTLIKGFSLPHEVAKQIFVEEFNSRCAPAWEDREIEHKLRQAAQSDKEDGYLLKGGNSSSGSYSSSSYTPSAQTCARENPRESLNKIQPDEAAILKLANGAMIDAEWLRKRSPIDLSTIQSAKDFLSCVYGERDNVLIFTRFQSQGDFIFEGKRKRFYHLGATPSVDAKRVEDIPNSAPDGMWFMANPVTGKWEKGFPRPTGETTWTRRSGQNLTDYRFMVLESDKISDEDWLGCLYRLPIPIVALYTSGGKSIHALTRIGMKTEEHFRDFVNKLKPLFAKYGGDVATMRSVQLTRLPFCFREGKTDRNGKFQRFPEPVLQKLLYLNPSPQIKPHPIPLVSMPQMRD